jgi:tRNA A-37 threonylcarbamoyl transferase component Bud32
VRLPDRQRSRAVLIGTGRYADGKLPDLPVVRRTISDLAAALTDPVYGVVPDNHCTVLEDQADIRLIGRHLRSAASQAEDLLLVYFVGHGLVAGRRHELYLGLSDSEWAEPEFNSLEYDKLRSAVLGSAAATKIIILDCCFSGRVVSEAMADPVTEMVGQMEVDGTYVLASAGRDQVALIRPGEDYTAFTGRLLYLLRNGVPGGPELLTVDYLYRQLVVRMRAEGLSQPQKRGTSTADLLALAGNRALMEARSPRQPPRLLGGRYELDGVVGRGGMAEVYRARDIRLNRIVAIKTLRTDLARDQIFQARFRREAEAEASLNHPSIVAVYDTGEDMTSGVPVPYMVMEYMDGRTVRNLLQEGYRLLPERSLEIIDGVLRALDYSHQAGIVHRDIKPGNVMVTRNGDIKVMDFGLARMGGDAQTAQVIGTAQYLSPEQARGERVDSRSDLYSTGCLLYELLTGRPPFTGDSPVAIAYQHVRENPVPPSRVDPDVPPWADGIVLKAMAKSPADRYQTAADMRADLQRAASGVPIAALQRAASGVPIAVPRPGRAKPEPEPQDDVPAAKVVRQQPIRQARSKRSGKR